MTPEGKIKAQVRSILTEAKANGVALYFFFPPANGYGRAGVPDVVGSCRGRFFAIETKVPGRTPTALQQREAGSILDSGGAHFLIYGTEQDFVDLRNYLYNGQI